MLRVTADTNVIISGLNFSGNPRHVLEMAEDGAIHLAVSDAILDEVERVLRHDKFGWPEDEFDKAIRQITRFTEHGSLGSGYIKRTILLHAFGLAWQFTPFDPLH